MLRSLAAISVFAGTLFAQHSVPPEQRYERIICIVPMVGRGTWEDPKRPLFAPLPSEMGRNKSGILAYYHEPTDDGKRVIVEFVAAGRSAFRSILASSDPSVQVFERGKQPQKAIEAALKAARKDFNFQRFAVRVP